jgi:hypothetical protein
MDHRYPGSLDNRALDSLDVFRAMTPKEMAHYTSDTSIGHEDHNSIYGTEYMLLRKEIDP